MCTLDTDKIYLTWRKDVDSISCSLMHIHDKIIL